MERTPIFVISCLTLLAALFRCHGQEEAPPPRPLLPNAPNIPAPPPVTSFPTAVGKPYPINPPTAMKLGNVRDLDIQLASRQLQAAAGQLQTASGQQMAPLGRAVVGGLSASTLATLTLLPLVFAVIMRGPARSTSLDPDDPASPHFAPEGSH